MRVHDLIVQLLDRPMTDRVVFRPNEAQKGSAAGYWHDLKPEHVRPGGGGGGITILELQEPESCKSQT